ncbi:MAG: AraC family transcriptional regulator [Rhodospirillaceae bacterium]|nr:AraC family transcriptional regulator [Rhodospirillaceae bacterium]
MAADALSDVLKTIRLTGATYFDVNARAPWVAEQPTKDQVLPKVLPGAGHLIAWHIVTEGQCYTNIIGEEPMLVEAGEVIVFTRGDPHVFSSHPGMRTTPVAKDALDSVVSSQLPFHVSYGEGPTTAKLVCGFLACDAQPFNPLLDNLPPVIKLSDRQGSEPGWLSQFVRLAKAETSNKRAGGEGVLSRLSELMFIVVVRRYIENLAPNQGGWLAGLREPFIGKALSLLHGNPSRDWTIEELAREVGVSRSVLAERFGELVGMPPMLYLSKWRMQLASCMLSAGDVNIAQIAAEIGYGSEAAFSRAFKKLVGVPPSAWRRKLRVAA